MVMPKYETKTEWTASQIRDSILSGQLLPGERIRIHEWARRLAVSPTPIREALKALQAEGYVRISAHRGAEVTAFLSKEFSDSIRITLALDMLATEFAVERLHGSRRVSECKRMRNVNDELRAALKSGRARDAERLNQRFHQAIYDAADSPLLAASRDSLWGRIPVAVNVFWKMVTASADWTEQICTEHGDMIDAIEAGQHQRAIWLTRDHLERGARRLSEMDTDGATEPFAAVNRA